MDYVDSRSLLDKILYRIAATVCLIPGIKEGNNLWSALYYSRYPAEIDQVPEYPNVVKLQEKKSPPPMGCGPTHIDRADFYALQTSDFYTPSGQSYAECRQAWTEEIAKLDALIDEADAMHDAYAQKMRDYHYKSPRQWDKYEDWIRKYLKYTFDLALHRERGRAIISKIDSVLGRPAA